MSLQNLLEQINRNWAVNVVYMCFKPVDRYDEKYWKLKFDNNFFYFYLSLDKDNRQTFFDFINSNLLDNTFQFSRFNRIAYWSFNQWNGHLMRECFNLDMTNTTLIEKWDNKFESNIHLFYKKMTEKNKPIFINFVDNCIDKYNPFDQ